MKLPLFLRRKADGDLVFPFAGKMWRCIDDDGRIIFKAETPGAKLPDISWLRANAQLFLEKRNADNMAIQQAREKVVGAIILLTAVLLPILVVHIFF